MPDREQREAVIRMQDHIHAHVEDELRLEDICAASLYSQRHARRLFRELRASRPRPMCGTCVWSGRLYVCLLGGSRRQSRTSLSQPVSAPPRAMRKHFDGAMASCRTTTATVHCLTKYKHVR